ncbi:hypothetical protein ZWY2020_030300 [Hordeum vulgare]|nr:hypothetical protein ZWY2020_030300 [Hordeum vulgare]
MAKKVSWTPTMSKFMLTWLSDMVSSGNRTMKLKDLSGALWDEDKSMIVLDHEHYTNHVKAHPEDKIYLNNTIIHYKKMMNITGGSIDPIATEVVDIEEDTTKKPTALDEEVAQSTNEVHPVPTQNKPNQILVRKTEKSSNTENNAINGLWESMKVLPRFSLDYLAHYYAYLVGNPRVAMAFKVLEEDQKKVWVSRYVKNTFPKV